MLTFSIIIPVYNTEKHLSACLDSCLNQTYKNIEVICVNDCSTDTSGEIIRRYAEKDERIFSIVLEKNVQSYMARKTGLEKITGDYVLFLDSDDTLTPGACEILSLEINKRHSDIIQFGYINKQKIKIPLALKNSDEYVRAFLSREYKIPPAMWSRAYSSSLIKKALPILADFRAFMAEDVYYAVVFHYYAKSFSRINRPLLNYFDNGESNSDEYNISKYKSWVESYGVVSRHIKRFIESNAPQYLSCCLDVEVRFLKEFLQRLPPPCVVLSLKQKKEIADLLTAFFDSEVLFSYFDELRDMAEAHDMYVNPSRSKTKRIKRIIKLAFKTVF
jgi:glycosyltransferase involved in cell wall biosynthesis